MKRAVLWIRAQPHYRREAFEAGLRKLDFEICERVNNPHAGDVLVSWNMYPSNEPVADAWRRDGAKVLIAENGYIGKDADGQQLYALARDGHNGSGKWFVGPQDRWGVLRINLQPFRVGTGPVIVRAQRGIGTKQMASPARWARDTVAALQKVSTRPVILRLHPGMDMKQERDDPDEKALATAHSVVIWASSFGVKALVAGVPVFCAAPHWIAKGMAKSVDQFPDTSILDIRPTVFHRLAWAQWTIDEIASGVPFEYLLERLP